MTIPASDIDALFDLIERAGKKLRDRNPDHELLQFLDPVMEEAPWTKEIAEKFLEQFDKDGKQTVITIRVFYLHALDKANNTPAT
jgi:hypothetical protein